MREASPRLAARPRSLFGKKVRFLRRDGWTPANIFGHGVESVAIQVNTREAEHTFAHVPRNALLSLVVDGAAAKTVLIRGVQRKPTTDLLYHIDFYQVSMTERLKADVPLRLVGESPAAKFNNATILHAMSTLAVECLPGDLPTQIEVDLERLVGIDDAMYVRDLQLPPGVTAAVEGDDLIVKALAPRVEEVEGVAPEEAEAPAPEVVAAGPPASEAGEAEQETT
jgi:large subunit ribosomal protein L25